MTEPDPIAGAPLSISAVARLAGVTPRAIRHYHATGALPEVSRDSSGYRRYAADDVIAAVRVARLRALGMPIPQIAAAITTGGPERPLAESMHALADDLDREIAALTGVRDRLRALAGSPTLDHPAAALAVALRAGGRLAAGDLPPAEARAAALVDALHPGGMPGMLEQAAVLLDDPAALERLDALLQRFRGLSAEHSEADVEQLATELAAAVPRPAGAAPSIDVDLMDKLMGDRLNPAQRRVLHRLREMPERADA